MNIEIFDNLNYKDNPEIKSIINNENIYFSGKVTKIRDWRWNQERNFIITDKAIYNLKNLNNLFLNESYFPIISFIRILNSFELSPFNLFSIFVLNSF